MRSGENAGPLDVLGEIALLWKGNRVLLGSVFRTPNPFLRWAKEAYSRSDFAGLASRLKELEGSFDQSPKPAVTAGIGSEPERERLIRALRLHVACLSVTVALKGGEGLLMAREHAAKAFDLNPAEVKWVNGKEGADPVHVVVRIWDSIRGAVRAEEESAPVHPNELSEAEWVEIASELTLSIMGAEPADRGAEVAVRVLATRGDEGLSADLILQKRAHGPRKVRRDLEEVLLPVGGEFADAIATVEQFALNPGAFGEGVSRRSYEWKDGAITWRIERHDGLAGVDGPSMGAAFGAGILLLLAGQEGDLTIPVTAAVRQDGSLATVAGLGPKLAAAFQAVQFKAYKVLLANGQDSGGLARHQLKNVSNVWDVATFIADNSRPRRQIRAAMAAHCKNLPNPPVGKPKFNLPTSESFFELQFMEKVSQERLEEIRRREREEAERRSRDTDGPEVDRTRSIWRLDELRWLRGEAETRYEPKSVREVLRGQGSRELGQGSLNRIAVLGPPGSGKSALSRHLWQWLDDPDNVAAVGSAGMLPLLFEAKRWVESDMPPLPKYLAHQVRDWIAEARNADPRGRSELELPNISELETYLGDRLLPNGEAFLIVDGLDEASRADLTALCNALRPHSACRMLSTCRTAVWPGTPDAALEPLAPGPGWSVYTLGELNDDGREKLSRDWFRGALSKAVETHSDAGKKEGQAAADERRKEEIAHASSKLAEQLNDEIDRNPPLLPLATLPLMLIIMVRVYLDNAVKIPGGSGSLFEIAQEGNHLPNTRTELYAQVLRLMFEDTHRNLAEAGSANKRVFEEVVALLDEEELVEVLAGAASRIFRQEPGFERQSHVLASRKAWQNAMAVALRDHRAAKACAGVSVQVPPDRDVVRYLVEIVGVLQGDDTIGLLHTTFHEYLTAIDLARRAEEVGYNDALAEWRVEKWQRVYKVIDDAYEKKLALDESKKPEDRTYDEFTDKLSFDPWPAEDDVCEALLRFIAFIDHKIWDPAWHEVLRFFAGCMGLRATPWLVQAGEQYQPETDKRVLRDDYFRHRLALACESMLELPPPDREDQEARAAAAPSP